MNKTITTQPKTKRGVTSLLVVVIIILVFGVIVVSFTRLILSEALQTTNNDLSQSAYDSAMAGIEDAKTALLQYHSCLSGKSMSTSVDCNQIISRMQAGIRNHDCDTIAKVLNRSIENGGVVIQETKNSGTMGNSADMLQAYTCVTIEEELDDYRTTLDSENAFRIVPIRTDVSKINDVDYIEINWYSQNNYNKRAPSTWKFCNGLPKFGECSGGIMDPTLLGVGLIQTDTTFQLSELSMANNSNQTDRAQIYLKPTNNNTAPATEITAAQFTATANGSTSNDGSNQNPFPVKCGATFASSTGFYCSAKIKIPKPFKGGNRNTGAFFLMLSLPYAQPETDVAIKMHKSDGSLIPLDGVQSRVDSTGRANDLYRRIETRVELVDTYFPYPQYEVQMSSDPAADPIKKTFWSTHNCWITDESDESGNAVINNCADFHSSNSLSTWN